MNILVTGSNGFIAKNLILELKNKEFNDISLCNRQTSKAELDELLKKCDVVVHLAGVNRPQNEQQFKIDNVNFTKYIIDFLQRNNNKAKIIYSSSIQADKNNLYGISKKDAEEIILEYNMSTDTEVKILRLPNVFGKWCRPDYNSVVATFCNNIARDYPIKINDRDSMIKLVYIDDVVDCIIDCINGYDTGNKYCDVKPVYDISVGQLADIIYSFKKQRTELCVPRVDNDFEKKLYSTYLSYMPLNDFGYDLKMNCDDRGSFTEIIRTNTTGQISVNIAKPGITKGNHWHNTKVEKFVVVKGIASIKFRHMITGEEVEYIVSGDNIKVIDIPVGYTHNITNIGTDDLVTVMWANEPFNKDRPDTYYEKV